MAKPRKIGLALGGGAARGWAHLGVLQALEEIHLPVAAVAGTSIGALVGGFFAAGRIHTLRELALQLDWRQVLQHFLEVPLARSGLVDGRKMMNFIRQHVAQTRIESLRVPYRAVATDLFSGREVVFTRGDLIEAVRASIAIPGMFTPVPRDGALLADGGLVNPLPISVVRAMKTDAVIAVDLNFHPAARTPPVARKSPSVDRWASGAFVKNIQAQWARLDWTSLAPVRHWLDRRGQPTIFDVLGHSIRIVEAQITETRLLIEPPDVLIRPDLSRIGIMEFHRAADAMAAGYRAALTQREALLALMKTA